MDRSRPYAQWWLPRAKASGPSHVNQLRTETACRLLATTELPVTEVAARSGYQNLSNFNRRFLELQRMRPSEYRAAHLSR
ncbi:helix-turn-helix domain-containing protein [Streptomyces sp. NPDC055092]